MRLTKGEFSLFSLKSQIQLIHEKGVSLISMNLNEELIVRLILIYDFYVEVIYEKVTNRIKEVNLAINHVPLIYFDSDEIR